MAFFVMSLLKFVSSEYDTRVCLAPCNSNMGYHHCLPIPDSQLIDFSLAALRTLTSNFLQLTHLTGPLPAWLPLLLGRGRWSAGDCMWRGSCL